MFDQSLQRDIMLNKIKPHHILRLKTFHVFSRKTLQTALFVKAAPSPMQWNSFPNKNQLIAPCLQTCALHTRRVHDRSWYEFMHIAIDLNQRHPEWWGHTLGFKRSLSIHTTVAVWNAHHAWAIRAKTLQCIQSMLKLKLCSLVWVRGIYNVSGECWKEAGSIESDVGAPLWWRYFRLWLSGRSEL